MLSELTTTDTFIILLPVSILVVMEYALGAANVNRDLSLRVSILVVMEYALGV